MEIRYARWLSGLILVSGGLNLVAAILSLMLGKFQPTLILGILFIVMGVMYWQRPYFSVQKDYVVVPALIGPVKKEFYAKKPGDIKVEDGKLMVHDGAVWKRVPVYRWMSLPDDWSEMVKYVQSISSVTA